MAVTQENFGAECLEFHKDSPKLFVMLRPAGKAADLKERRHSDQCASMWFTYLHAKGFGRTLAVWKAILASGRPVMVPCENPEHFDIQYVAPDHAYVAPEDREMSPEARERVNRRFDDLLRRAAKSSRMGQRKKYPNPEDVRRDAQAALDAYSHRPWGDVALTPEALRTCGVDPSFQDAAE